MKQNPLLEKHTLCDILILAGFMAIAFFSYGMPSLFPPDEGRYANIAREMLAHHQYLIPHLNGVIYFEKPPLIYWMTAFMIHLFGHSQWAVRLINPLLSLIGVWFTYICCRIVYTRRIAFLAAMIAGTSFLYLAIGRMLTLDCGVAFFLNVCLLSFLVSMQYYPGWKKTAWLWLAYAAAGAAVMTKGLIGILFPIMIIGLWVVFQNQWKQLRHMRIITGFIIVIAISAPWVILVQQHYPSFAYHYLIEQQFLRYFTSVSHRHMSTFAYIGVFALGQLPWIFFFCQSMRRTFKRIQTDIQHHCNDIYLFIWGIAITLFFGFSNSMLIPYLLPIIVPFGILAARYFDSVWGKPMSKTALASGIVFTVFCCIGMVALFVIPFIYHYYFAELAIPAWIGAGLLLMTFIISIIGLKKRNLKTMIVAMTTLVIVAINVAWIAGPYLNQRSVKPLAMVLNPLLKKYPAASVINYNNYYQDLPYYLRHRITIVNWHGELAYGYAHQPSAKQWMITGNQFWQRWNSHKLVFVLLNNGDYQNLFIHGHHHSHFLGATRKVSLVSNFPVGKLLKKGHQS